MRIRLSSHIWNRKNATSYSKLAELTKEKEEVERRLEEKMERWEYLNDLAEKIEKQKQW